MIFVTLGTHELSFSRLIQFVEEAVLSGFINEEVVIQAGNTKYKTNHERIKIKAFFDSNEMDKFYKSCNFLITHGGVGSISMGLKYHKKILVVPRYQKYKEHTSDHQLEIVQAFLLEKLILVCYDGDQFNDKLNQLNDFLPNVYQSKRSDMLHLIEEFIKKN